MGAFIPNLEPLYQLGIDPKTGLPLKCSESLEACPDVKRSLITMDMDECINLGTWVGLPNDITGALIERILYLRGQGIFFYMASNKTFYFLPFGVDGGVDVYGRYKGVRPLSFGGSLDVKDDKIWINELIKKPIWNVPYADADVLDMLDMINNGAVILTNRSRELSQQVAPEYAIVEPVIDMMAEAYPMARTNLMANSGIRAWRINSTDENTAEVANNNIKQAALTGRPFIGLAGTADWQDLTTGSAMKSEEFLLYMQSLDNYRQHIHGIGDGAIFEKKAHMLQAEAGINQSSVSFILKDKYRVRKEFCDIVNSTFGLAIDWIPDPSLMPMMAQPSQMLDTEEDDSDGQSEQSMD